MKLKDASESAVNWAAGKGAEAALADLRSAGVDMADLQKAYPAVEKAIKTALTKGRRPGARSLQGVEATPMPWPLRKFLDRTGRYQGRHIGEKDVSLTFRNESDANRFEDRARGLPSIYDVDAWQNRDGTYTIRIVW